MKYEFIGAYVVLMGTFVVPFVSQWLKKITMSRLQKFLITIGLCVISGFGGYAISGYPLSDGVLIITGTITLALSSYEIWWKKAFEDSVLGKKLGLRKVKTTKKTK